MVFQSISLPGFLLCAFLFCASVAGAENMQLKIIAGNDIITGELEDNPITRQLLEMGPLELKMEDYAGSEKIAYPPEKLKTGGAKHGLDPKKGDLALFGPWGNLVVFYRKGHASDGLYYLGKITSGLEKLETHAKGFEAIWEISLHPANPDQ